MADIYQVKLHGQQWQEIGEDVPIESLTSDRPVYGISRHPRGCYVPFIIGTDGALWTGQVYRDDFYAELELQSQKQKVERGDRPGEG